ncbi:DUF2164 domain-containing protein [Silvimonas sp. JCM 19000]
MADITFSAEQSRVLKHKLRRYLETELDIELGDFDAEFLLEFISKTFGAHYYNQGVVDAMAVLEDKMDVLRDGLLMLEKPV